MIGDDQGDDGRWTLDLEWEHAAMTSLREILKRALPEALIAGAKTFKSRLGPAPLEATKLHGYDTFYELDDTPRLTLVIPSINSSKSFGGVMTGVEIFLEIAVRIDCDVRILIDDFEEKLDLTLLLPRAEKIGLAPERIDVSPRREECPRVGIRRREIFFAFNWWTALNTRSLVQDGARNFSTKERPLVYIIQDYEPFFYPFSSTQMMALRAYDPGVRLWGLFNSSELHNFFSARGHQIDRTFVFEPQLSPTLQKYLPYGDARPAKKQRILVYGRPTIPRNCYPAVVAGLKTWSATTPISEEWELVSAGILHRPVNLGNGRVLKSLGKLSLTDYAQMLIESGVGLSLMASPHPSYPPLEMAHFGITTVTNTYESKELSSSHENIISISNIEPKTIATSLTEACGRVVRNPKSGWASESRRPSFLSQEPYALFDPLAKLLRAELAD